MDLEKLNKAADNYAHEHAWYPGETSYESDITAMEESFSDAFKAGAEWLQSQSLSDRLTEEEKAKINKRYKSEVNSMKLENRRAKYSQSQIEEICCMSNYWQHKSKADMLESIFTTSLFTDNNPKNEEK